MVTTNLKSLLKWSMFIINIGNYIFKDNNEKKGSILVYCQGQSESHQNLMPTIRTLSNEFCQKKIPSVPSFFFNYFQKKKKTR